MTRNKPWRPEISVATSQVSARDERQTTASVTRVPVLGSKYSTDGINSASRHGNSTTIDITPHTTTGHVNAKVDTELTAGQEHVSRQVPSGDSEDVLHVYHPTGETHQAHVEDKASQECGSSTQDDCSDIEDKDLSPARGKFHASSYCIKLRACQYLEAHCVNVRGRRRLSTLNLNDCLSNEDGHFKWTKGGNFMASATGIELGERGEILCARLRKCNGQWRTAVVRLTHRVSNENGRLVLVA